MKLKCMILIFCTFISTSGFSDLYMTSKDIVETFSESDLPKTKYFRIYLSENDILSIEKCDGLNCDCLDEMEISLVKKGFKTDEFHKFITTYLFNSFLFLTLLVSNWNTFRFADFVQTLQNLGMFTIAKYTILNLKFCLSHRYEFLTDLESLRDDKFIAISFSFEKISDYLKELKSNLENKSIFSFM